MSDDYASDETAYDGRYDGGYQGFYAYPGGDGTTGGEMAEAPDDRFATGEGIWQPLTQSGEFDAEATMNTPLTGQFPDFATLRTGTDPLAAPGHGYVPYAQAPPPASYDSAPPLTASGQWAVPADPVPLPVPDAGGGEQWSVPFAPEDPAEASGEYSVSQMIAGTHEPLVTGPFEETGPYVPADPAEPIEPAGLFEPVEPAGPPQVPVDLAGLADLDPYEEPAAGEPADGAAGFGAPDEDLGAALDPHSEHPTASYELTVNGADRPVTDAWLGESLLYVLRERLGLAGAKDGCEQGECGACSVQVDGRLVASCLMPAATAAGCEVRTVEGLARDGRPSDVQRALAECGAVQCGFCVPGFAMTVHDLLEGNHRPTELETRQALSGNLCRCSGYQGVLDAVGEVIAAREAAAEAEHPGHEGARIPHQSTGEPDGAPA